VRPEERNDNILAHEQGHFDLCELYTRKLRERMSNVQVNVKTLKPVLSSIYDQVQQEYRQRQEEYENDTEHGVNLLQQKKWQQMLERELGQTEDWSKS
jgi:predicted secreted Zn-dependent protease